MTRLRSLAVVVGLVIAAVLGTAGIAHAELVAQRHCSSASWCDVGFYSYGGPLVIEYDVYGSDGAAVFAAIRSSGGATKCQHNATVRHPALSWACNSPGYGNMYAIVSMADTNQPWHGMYIKVYRV